MGSGAPVPGGPVRERPLPEREGTGTTDVAGVVQVHDNAYAEADKEGHAQTIGSVSVTVRGDQLREGNEAGFFTGDFQGVVETTDKEESYGGEFHYFAGPAIFPPEPFFLGWSRELKEGQSATHPVSFDRLRSHTVLDELVISQTAPLAAAGFTVMRERWTEGRYYKENDAVFTSAPVEVRGALRSFRWTVLLPADPVRNGYLGRFEEVDETLSGSRLRVRIQQQESSGRWTDRTGWMDGRNGVALSGRVQGPVRYQVRFEPTPGWTEMDRLNRPVLETPFLDDAVLSWVPEGGAEVLEYHEDVGAEGTRR